MKHIKVCCTKTFPSSIHGKHRAKFGKIGYVVIHYDSVGGTTLDTHGRPHGLRLQGRPSPQDEALLGTTLLGASRKTPGRYPEDTTRSVRILMIP